MKFLPLVMGMFWFSCEAQAVQKIETNTPTRLAAARVFREMPDAQGIPRQVLVSDTKLAGPVRVEIDLDAPLHFQWYFNDRGQVTQYSFPYFAAKILAIPDSAGLSSADKARLMGGVFYFSLLDLTPSRIVSATFREDMPAGGRKPIAKLPWDAHNPKGTWGYAIEQAVTTNLNMHLLDAPPADINDFCPKFLALDRPHQIHFWQSLVTQISELESAHVPYCASDEGKYNPDSKGVISSGLVQISLLSVKNSCYQERGCSVIRTQEDLYDPAKNLRCGLAVMSVW